jgi:hypothetical protein
LIRTKQEHRFSHNIGTDDAEALRKRQEPLFSPSETGKQRDSG